MMESPFALSIPSQTPQQVHSPTDSKPSLLSPSEQTTSLFNFCINTNTLAPPLPTPSNTQSQGAFDTNALALTRNLAAFMQSNGLCSLPEGVFDQAERHSALLPSLHQLGGLSSFSTISSPPITPSSLPQVVHPLPSTPLPSSIPTSLPTSLPSSILDSTNTPLPQIPTTVPQSPIPANQTGVVQQIHRADIVTVQPRKPTASGGRGSIGLAVHVDGYLYHGKKTRLDGTKLLYCLDRTKYNCMAVAELFPNGTFRAKRPHTGHPPNPDECEVRLAKRMMRERAREHPEYTSKEIIREMVNDPNISEEAKKRLENYESLRKFVYRGRQSQRKPRPPDNIGQIPPVKMEENSAFSLPTSIAALLSQNVVSFPSMPPLPVHSDMSTAFMPTQNSLNMAHEEIARLMRELQNGKNIEEIRVKNELMTATVEPSTSISSATTSTTSVPAITSNSSVWHTVDCDIIDFSRMPDREYSYIFHAKDTVSRFSFAAPMKSGSESEVLEAVKLLFFTYGPAHVFRVDQTYQNLEQQLSSFFPLTAVEFLVPRKTPQGTLIPRREAAMMKERIFAWLMETGRKDWASALPQIKYAHNTEWIDEIECTPVEKFFSRNLPTGMSSRYSEENNESHDGMSEDGEEHNQSLTYNVKEEPLYSVKDER